jgi:hypothetical protein
MELITKLSGLLKAITYTIRVICRVSFKTVKMYENIVFKSSISPTGRAGLETSFATFGLCDGYNGVANVVYSEEKVPSYCTLLINNEFKSSRVSLNFQMLLFYRLYFP